MATHLLSRPGLLCRRCACTTLLSRRRPSSRLVSTRASAAVGDSFEDVLLRCNNINGLAHSLWAGLVRAGDTVVDCTAGNGHDTLALARLALTSTSGRVLAFDVQAQALQATRQRLQTELSPALLARCEFLHACHSTLGDHVDAPKSVALIAFNLGYLPGSGEERAITTQPETTTAALRAAAGLVRPGGCISIMCYTGHEGGAAEAAAVHEVCEALPTQQWTVTQVTLVNRQAAPHLVMAYRRDA